MRDGDVSQIDPVSRRVEHVAHVGGFPTSIAVGAGGAWIVDARSGTVTRLRDDGLIRGAVSARGVVAAGERQLRH